MTNKNVAFEQKNDKLFDALGIVCAQIRFEDEDMGEVWTRKDLNHAVGKMATLGLDLLTEGYDFHRKMNERLVPDIDAIAKAVATKQLEATDQAGYSFSLCDDLCPLGQHGKFIGPLGQTANIFSFEDAFSLARDGINKGGLPVDVGIKLLKDVLESPLPRLGVNPFKPATVRALLIELGNFMQI